MFKVLLILLTGIVTSFYFFPFKFSFLPIANTKMVLAVLGLLTLMVNLSKGRSPVMDKSFFILSVLGAIVSLIGFVSITINETFDYVYATYIVSMWVWLGGAYCVTRTIKFVHGQISIRLVCHYLIGVCVAQCIIAFLMGKYPIIGQFVDGFLGSEGYMGKVEGRLYGIGAALDVAGMRFAAVLIMIVWLCFNTQSVLPTKVIVGYIVAFLVICVIGNMIGRTTTIGMLATLGYWLWTVSLSSQKREQNVRLFSIYLCVLLLCFLPIIIYLYYTDDMVYQNIQFGFEGFFSLSETGKWETTSTSILQNMYVFPDNLKTWIIGDGYFDNPRFTDPYYIGYNWVGFYQDTDAGYLRFIYYFGVIGLLLFMFFMYKAAGMCMYRIPSHRFLFVAILILNYIVWIKVSSDLFLVLALFLCISTEEDNAYNESFGN